MQSSRNKRINQQYRPQALVKALPILSEDRYRYHLLNALILATLLCVTTLYPSFVLAEKPQAHGADWHYTLRPADNIKQVASRLLAKGHDWTDLVNHNQIKNPNKVLPGSILRIPIDWLKQKPQPASFLSTTGNVMIKRARDSQYKIARPDLAIKVGDEVTIRKGSALIKFADGTLIRLEKNSTLLFNKLSRFGDTGMVDTRLRLKKGSLSTEVQPLKKGSRYEIRTPSAVAAVRGTKFRLEAKPNTTKLEVTEGTVEFSHEHGRKVVSAGYGAKIKKGISRIETSKLPPAPEAMFANAEISKLPANLKWKDKTPDSAYQYELNDKQKGKRIQSATVASPNLELNHVPNGNYQVAMRSVDENGFGGLDSSADISVNTATSAPLLIAPSDGSILDTGKPQFSWSTEENVMGKLEVSLENGFNKTLSELNSHPGTLLTLNRSLNPGTYYWRVSTPNGDGTNSESDVYSFSVRGKMKSVKILSVNYIDNQVGLFWNTVKESRGYVLQLSDGPDFSKILKEETIGKNSAHLRLKPGNKYYARVKGIANDTYTSEFGPTKELFIKAK